MSADTKLAIIQLAVLIVLAALAHAFIRRRFVLVCIGVSMAGNLLAGMIVGPLFGLPISNLWPIACAFWFVPGFLVAALVGAPFWVTRRGVPAGHCKACGYDLRGNESGRCPECGAATGSGAAGV